MSDWTAYCAPGRRVIASLLLTLGGEDVSGVWESPVVQGSGIILVNEAAIGEAFSLDRPLEMRPPSAVLDTFRVSRPFPSPITGV